MVGDFFRNLVHSVQRDKEVIPFPTYGYRKGGAADGDWVIPLRVWVNKARRLPIPVDDAGQGATECEHGECHREVLLGRKTHRRAGLWAAGRDTSPTGQGTARENEQMF